MVAHWYYYHHEFSVVLKRKRWILYHEYTQRIYFAFLSLKNLFGLNQNWYEGITEKEFTNVEIQEQTASFLFCV